MCAQRGHTAGCQGRASCHHESADLPSQPTTQRRSLGRASTTREKVTFLQRMVRDDLFFRSSRPVVQSHPDSGGLLTSFWEFALLVLFFSTWLRQTGKTKRDRRGRCRPCARRPTVSPLQVIQVADMAIYVLTAHHWNIPRAWRAPSTVGVKDFHYRFLGLVFFDGQNGIRLATGLKSCVIWRRRLRLDISTPCAELKLDGFRHPTVVSYFSRIATRLKALF